nr:hypothetical protein [Moraxella sp. CTOTU48841]
MTVLVDKLEKELARNCRLNNWDLGFQAAIDIVKRHSDWQNLSSDTQLQDNQTCILIMQNNSDEYPVIYDVGLYRKNENSTAWLSLTKPESYIDESKILALHLIEPLSEVQNV